jgi:hypothetical protein
MVPGEIGVLLHKDKEMENFTQQIEREKRKQINKLMSDLKQKIKTKNKIIFSDDGKEYDAIDYFNSDGFLPGYYKKNNIKVLFIGRESRYCSGKDRVIDGLKWFKNGSPNASSYWRRILYIVFGIKTKGEYSYDEIPYANEILSDMNKNNDYGFAIMNVSKYSNDAEDGASANISLINRFLEDSDLRERNYIREEIEVLEPDIIITANLWGCNIDNSQLGLIFPDSDFNELQRVEGIANLYEFKFGARILKLLDLYHFSCRGSDQKKFYEPTMKLLFNK